MLKQHKLSVAVTVAMGIALGATNVVQAQEAAHKYDSSGLFFPHLVGSSTLASIVSVMNVEGGFGDTTNGNLHLRLWSKKYADKTDIDGNVLKKAYELECGERNTLLTTSYNDIATFDVYGTFGQQESPKGLLFEGNLEEDNVDQTNNISFSVGAALPKPQRGFLLVDNSGDTAEAALFGEAFIFDFANGATWGYMAYSRPVSADYDRFNFASAGMPAGGFAPIALMPFDEFATGLMVTPVDRNQNAGDLMAEIGLYYAANEAGGLLGMYDRDENPLSGGEPVEVTCIGRVDPKNILSPFDSWADGGWTTVVVNAGGAGAACAEEDVAIDGRCWHPGAVVYKLEYNLGNTFNGEAVGGTFNNAIELESARGLQHNRYFW